MLIRKPAELTERDVTPEALYARRRDFIKGVGMAAAALMVPLPSLAQQQPFTIDTTKNYAVGEDLTSYPDATGYINYYEFSTRKEGIGKLAEDLDTKPWEISVEGMVHEPRSIMMEDIYRLAHEERIYRFRCVEAWSMVIPWDGVPLARVIELARPLSSAKYVEFTTLFDPSQMPNQDRNVLDWPYVEGLRMDEAMHPLAFLATGMYGKPLPNQNGAPIRLVVPWKYGFKSIKAIVKMRFTDTRPVGTWEQTNPNEYGFFANVNPDVSHPRWTQAKERRIGELFKRPTLPFNGYAEQVAGLYEGLDLKRNF